MRSVHWYWKRLRVMGPAELGWRVLEAARMQQLHARFASGSLARAYARLDHRRLGFCTAVAPQLPALPFAFTPGEEEAESWLNGRWHALGFGWQWTEDRQVWHRAPDTGRHWPRQFFGSVPYRDGNPFGDARVVWEPARLQQLHTLGLLAETWPGARARAADMIARQIASWMEENPVGTGIHYVSAMECALRLIAVAFAVDMVRKDLLDRPSVWTCCAQLIASHADLIGQRLSLHSSAGNHTIAEGAGLVFAGLLLADLPPARRWVAVGLKALRTESVRQVLPDGGGIERSTWYHLFVIDLLGLIESLLSFKGREIPDEIATAVARGRVFLGAMADRPDALPLFGDADGGYALSPWLRLSFEEPARIKEADPAFRAASFPDTGLTRVCVGGERGTQLVMDHGPLGMPPSFGHGHADALSLSYCVAGKEICSDCGTFTYTGDQRWRNYFRGTRAHNTVMVDGQDQACGQTPFMWSRPYAAELRVLERRSDDQILLLARHTGYQHLGVEHWRGILFAPCVLIVWDGLLGCGDHTLELHWHLGADVQGRADDRFILDGANPQVTMRVRGGTISVRKGCMEPISGWRSPAYGQRLATTTVQVGYQGKVPHEFVSVFSLGQVTDEEVALAAAVAAFRGRVGWT